MSDQEKSGKGMWSLPVLRKFAPPEEVTTDDRGRTEGRDELVPWNVPGTQLRTRSGRAGRGWYAPALAGAPSTTRQAEILNTAVIGAPTGTRGVVTGRDVLSKTPIAHDPVTAYNAQPRLVSSPNVVVMGDVGSGKSSFVKTACVVRPLIMAYRRAVVFDKKDRAGEGEYSELAREFGAEPIRFAADGDGTRLNLLDPMITRAKGDAGQLHLLKVVTALARNGRPLDEWEEEALRSALRSTLGQFEGRRRHATLADVLPALAATANDGGYSDHSPQARDKLHQAGLSVQFTFNTLLDDYAGLLDGETSAAVDLAHKLTSWDISQLPDDGPAVPIVMAIGHMWLLGRLRQDRGWHTTCVYEEGWHIAAGPSASLARANQKLSRGLGLSNVFVFHKGTDIPKDSPGMAMVQEAQSVYVYRQSRPEDAEWCQQTFNFAPERAADITRLSDGHHYFKYGSHVETLVKHIRSDWETRITNTDEGMQGAAAAALRDA